MTSNEAETPDHRFAIDDFVDAIRAEAHRVQGSAEALVGSGAFDAIPSDIRRRIDCLDAAANFIDRMKPFLPEFRDFLRSRRFVQGRRA